MSHNIENRIDSYVVKQKRWSSVSKLFLTSSSMVAGYIRDRNPIQYSLVDKFVQY
jgi:hypothetical protein